MFLKSGFRRSGLYWAPDGSNGGGTPPAGDPPANPPAEPPATPQTWDSYLEGLSDDIKALYNTHTQGLRNTVQATRTERDALSQKLGELTKALGKDTPEEARRLLSEMQGGLETANRRATFYEQATSREVGCRNPKLAWLAAQESGAVNEKGEVNWETLKQGYPELFGPAQPTPPQTPQVPPTNPANPGKLTLDGIKRMTPDEINKRWDEVQAVLAGQAT